MKVLQLRLATFRRRRRRRTDILLDFLFHFRSQYGGSSRQRGITADPSIAVDIVEQPKKPVKTMRQAAYMLAVSRVVEATTVRGIFP